ncbi:hypothetical protein GIB67_022783 [Kingdonia uniflora]|uniref:DUF4378 domain-containing protein n=1 Tax=Kingdonia uniflora TaxID=39325 RepID=A0A7J7P752_9MAGN|nr:hypothetical protein GIB67_022783 [Kingdonia uniflora]
MTKRSKRRIMRSEKDHTGCMTGWISIFDFRQTRSTQKLLSDASSRNSAGTASSKSKVELLPDFDSDNKHSDKVIDVGDLTDDDESKILNVDVDKTTVKKIVKNEISVNGQTKNNVVEQLQPNSDHGRKSGKNRKQKNKAQKEPSDTQASANFDTQECYLPNPLNQSTHLDLASLVEELCSFYEGDLSDVQNSISSVLQGKTTEEAMVFLSEKFISAKKLDTDGGLIHESKHFVDALEMLSSNKELLVKLLQDSNSLLVKHIQDLRATESENEEISKPRHTFFRKKNKFHSKNQSKESDDPQVSNRIIVLKPKPEVIQNLASVTSLTSSPHSHYSFRDQGHSGRFNSAFSLSEIKRKLKHAIGEGRNGRHLLSTDGVPRDIPYRRQEKLNGSEENTKKIAVREKTIKPQTEMERKPEPSISGERGDISIDTPTHGPPRFSLGKLKKRESNIYIEAKKHLAEMLSNGNSPIGQTPRTLGRILSLSEHNSSPIFSPGRDRSGDSFVTAQMRFTPYGNLRVFGENIALPKHDKNVNHQSPERHNSEILTCNTTDTNLENKFSENDSNPSISREILPDTGISENVFSSGGGSSSKGGEEIVVLNDPVYLEETNFLDTPSESKSCTPDTTSKICEEGSSICLAPDLTAEAKPPSFLICDSPPSSLQIQKAGTLESMHDGLERPSPVSVLEQFLDEEVMSPSSTTSQHAEMGIQPLHIDFDENDSSCMVVSTSNQEDYLRTCIDEEHLYSEYVRALLKASNIRSLDHPLDPSLFDEVDVLPDQLGSRQKLLFDCVNEVLAELYDRYFGCSPWIAYVNPNIRPPPVGETLMHEVWETIVCHLPSQLQPRTLDDIVGKDMEKSRMWMDLRFDTEDYGVVIADEIVEELMEDTMFDL